MTINVVGAQGNVNSTIAIAAATQALAEVTIFTTAATANYIAIVDLSAALILLPAADAGALLASFAFALPGDGAGGSNSAGGNTSGVIVNPQAAMNFGGNTGLLVAVGNATPVRSFGAYSSRVKVGPSTAVKFTYAIDNRNASAGATLYYNVSYHVLYVNNP